MNAEDWLRRIGGGGTPQVPSAPPGAPFPEGGGVLGYCVYLAPSTGGRPGLTHTTPMTLEEAQAERKRWRAGGRAVVVELREAPRVNTLAVTAADPIADPEPLAAELVARWCGTRAPGALELLDILGIDLSAGPSPERPEPVPVTWPDTYRRGRKARRQ